MKELKDGRGRVTGYLLRQDCPHCGGREMIHVIMTKIRSCPVCGYKEFEGREIRVNRLRDKWIEFWWAANKEGIVGWRKTAARMIMSLR